MSRADVLILVSPGPAIGGAEFQTLDLAAALHGHSTLRTKVLVSHNRSFTRLLERHHIPYQWLGHTIATAAYNLAQAVKALQPGLVHTNGYHSSFIAVTAKLLSRRLFREPRPVRLSCTAHGWTWSGGFEALKTRLDLATLRFFDTIILVDPSLLSIATKHAQASRIECVRPLIDWQRLEHPLPIALPWATRREKVILGVGRLAREKQFDVFLRVAAIRATSDAELRFIIVGDGPERGSLERLAQQLGLRDRAYFAGFTERVSDYYECAGILLICSTTEACPRVALEAMRSDLLVVARDVGGLPRLLGDGRGFIYSRECGPNEIASVVQQVTRLPPEQRAEIRVRARQHVMSHHSLVHGVATYETVFKGLMHA